MSPNNTFSSEEGVKEGPLAKWIPEYKSTDERSLQTLSSYSRDELLASAIENYKISSSPAGSKDRMPPPRSTYPNLHAIECPLPAPIQCPALRWIPESPNYNLRTTISELQSPPSIRVVA